MNYNILNEVIHYIENNLTNKIDMQEISKITGMNDFIFQRIFAFLTNMTFTEYVKKRRLSRAYEDIKKSEDKIIDIAFKYQYNSLSSFNRAFKKLFEITPSVCRKNKINYQIIPIFTFNNANENITSFSFEIKDIKAISLYCYHLTSDDNTNFHYKIRKLYEEIKQNGDYTVFNENGMYGIAKKENNLYNYYIGSKRKMKNLEAFTIQPGKYAVFKVPVRTQKHILETEEKIYNQWFTSTLFKRGANPDFEYYEKDYCYLYISIN